MVSINFSQHLKPAVLIGISVAAIILAYLSSFRLGISDPQFAFTANFDRAFAAATVGIAFASVGALSTTAASIRFHVVGFAAVTFISSIFLLGNYLAWPAIATVFAGLASGASFCLLMRYTFNRPSENLWAALALAVVFILSIINFLGAAALDGLTREVVFWLQGNLLPVGGHSIFGFLLALALIVWILIYRSAELPIMLLFGLGLAIGGPLFFVSCLIPISASNIIDQSQKRSFLAVCAALGALIVVLADVIPRLFLGGYAPTLIVPIALVSIPILLCIQLSRSLTQVPFKGLAIIESTFVLLWLVGFSVIFYHVISFANLAT